MPYQARLAHALIPTLLVAGLFSLPAQASEESVKKAMEAKLGGHVDSVSKTAYMGGLYEVIAGGHVLYTDETVSAFIEGSLFDAKSMKNVTGQSLKKYYAQQYGKLPFDHAVKVVRGNGKRAMVTFEDPNCGYCKKLAGEIGKMDNITVYTFLLPILSADSEEKSRNIWCSADRAKAWTAWMVDGVKPAAAKADCAWSRNDMMALGQKFSVQGTPAILFADGELMPGYLPAAELDKRLGKPTR
ncbi:MAG: DsbC family protein [Rhodocyclaceae bacterium]|nr:DsbC family protein [Rhodocyclaceae bacterium]